MNFIRLKNNFINEKSTSENFAFKELDFKKKEMNNKN